MLTKIRRKAIRTPFIWRWGFNFNRTRKHQSDLSRAPEPLAVGAFRREGIVDVDSAQLFSKQGMEILERVKQHARQQAEKDEIRAILSGEKIIQSNKDYRLHLLPRKFDLNDPYIQLAIEPQLLSLVNGYMGMRSFLRAIVMWLDVPTAAPAKETQLWHRDDDDFMNVKVFIYLTDVDMNSGPFCFIPRTHFLGDRRDMPESDVTGRTTDEQMARIYPVTQWKICTGSSDSIILVDTGGFHKGLKPTKRHRLLLQFQYTSGCPNYPRSFEIGSTEGKNSLSTSQLSALFD